MLVHATGAPAFSAACSGGNAASQCTPRNLRPVTFPAASKRSQRSGGTITSGWISLARSKPASSEIIGVSVIPPGIKTLTIHPEHAPLGGQQSAGKDNRSVFLFQMHHEDLQFGHYCVEQFLPIIR